MRQIIWAVALMVTLKMATTDPQENFNDFTCINTNPFYNEGSSINFVAAGPGAPPVRFRRYQITGSNQRAMANGETTAIGTDMEYRTILTKSKKAGEAMRNGVFSCTTSSGGKETVIPVFSHIKIAEIHPDGFVTKTVNQGDSVTLSVVTKVGASKLKWRKNGKEIKMYRKKESIEIENASVKDSGIYECYVGRKKPHAVMRLIVRACAANLIGENCDEPCYCYNGGVCSDDGFCICPPGFSGELCEEIVGPNCFGQSCQYLCNDPDLSGIGIDGTCGGHLFCLPDPYGCSCSPGYKGIACDEECEDGSFGANCEQTCRCADGGDCDNKMGICTPAGCQDGWTGDNCNERITCRNSDPCQNGGVCQNVDINQGYECICSEEYTGEHCESRVMMDPCDQNPCENDGTCQRVGMSEDYTCICTEEYTGQNCEEEVADLCDSNPCQNDGVCSVDGDGYRCACQPGFKGNDCEVVQPCQCKVWGDPHHITFDGGKFTFQGECEYVISEHTEIQSETSRLPAFTLSSQYHKRNPGQKVTYVTFVRLQYNGKDYRLQKKLLFVDGALFLTPYNSSGVSIALRTDGTFRLTTDFGLTVEYKGTAVSVSLHAKYRNEVNGICGNCDGDQGNDCKGKGRVAARCGNHFAISEDCKSGKPTDPCLESTEHRKDASELCGIISDRKGPFSTCSEVVDLGALEEVCEYDMCATLPDQSLFCSHLENLVAVCKGEGVDVGTWRDSVRECPFNCPEGTVYNHCGNACPATCAWEEDDDCGDECLETCDCPENFVIADGKCIPREECGCQLADGSYLPGGGTAYNNDCSEVCSCNSGKLSCQTTSCHGDATCQMKAGVRRCYCNEGFVGNGQTCKPVETCQCIVWGDPHYRTFDMRKYDFQGDCEYTLLKPCRDSDQPTFELIGNNLKNSEASSVSYLRELRLEFQGKVYELLQNGALAVNGQNRHLPYQDGNGVRISKNSDTVLLTDFGLKVVWNNRQTATIILKKSAYFDNTCGLCGTCNGNSFDEFLTSNGATISNAIEFASSWKTGERQCLDPEPVVCPAGESGSVEAQNNCNAIIDPLGALAVCHDFVDAQQFYETCVYDMCADNSDTNLCNNMMLYAEKCTEAGGSVPNWYEDRTECQPVCAENMVYVQAPQCPPSCAEPQVDDNCEPSLLGSCWCPFPLLIDGDECVQSCGGCRLDDGSYVQDAETVVDDDCSQTCTCVEGDMQCSTLVCSEFAECGLRAGVRGCVCQEGFVGNGQECVEAACECLAWGDPHYVTFDGARYDFQGDCEYILVERCLENEDPTSPVPQYRVVANNVKDYPGAPVSYTRAVRLEVGDNKYEVKTNNKVFINDIQQPLPYTDLFVKIYFLFPNKVVIDTFFQLSIIFQSPHTARVKVYHEMHLGRTCGLCGTCNRDPSDEFMLPNKNLALTASQFGNGWATNARECVEDSEEPACEEESAAEKEALDLCSVLTSVTGPFASCHDFVDPQPVFDTCSYDVCAVPEKEEALCDNVAVYARSCQEAGGSPGNWWNDVPQCDPVCPDGMIYDPCGSACQETCALERDDHCKFHCEEVCRCPDGQVLDGDKCVAKSECGCKMDAGGYLQVGEEWLNEDCTSHCSCTESGIQCQDYSCPLKSTCDVKNGIRNCYCPPGYSLIDGACDRGTCICNIYGDPHYSTFDRRKYDYQGDCEYILVEKCGDTESNNLPDFKLIGRHSKNAPADRVSYLRNIRLEYAGKKYEVSIGGRVLVDGLKVFLPYVDEEVGIRIGTHVYGHTTIIADFGLVVLYDNVQKAEIHLSSDHFGLTCGMCGTCTDDGNDDFKLRDGTIANSVAEFGADYRYDDTCETDETTENPCNEGSPEHTWAKNLCYWIIRNPGPFSECYDFLDPHDFYESCVMDVCVSKIASMSCSIMDLYFQRCWQEGAKIPLWWDEVPHCPADEGNPTPPIEVEEPTKSLCELLREHRVANAERTRRRREVTGMPEKHSRKKRQADQTGQEVGTCADGKPALMMPVGCQATCDDPSTAGCGSGPPVLTCICPFPTLLQGNKCINQNECPCDRIDGIQLEVGQCLINTDCTFKYCCDANQDATKTPYDCDANAECRLVNNERSCYCNDGFTGDGLSCQTDTNNNGGCQGDPHFTTFDGRRYDFMGACEYTMVEVCAIGGGIPYFKIIGDFGSWVYNTRATVTNSIRLEFEGSVYEVRRVPRGFFVNGASVNLPYTKGQVSMTYYHSTCVITGQFGVRIQVNFQSTYLDINVRMSSIYSGKTCGLLGNANRNRNDDFKLPNGNIVNNANQFGNSWVTGNRQCRAPTGADPCANGSARDRAAKSQCYVLLNKLAPLSACHDLVDPQPYYTSCVFDVCVTNLNVDQLCGAIKNYVKRCRALQGNPGEWWKYVTQCAVPCPEGWEYTDCGTSCPATCEQPKGVPDCEEECIETCVCPEGQVMDGTKCVFPYNCGCTLPDDVYLEQGQVYVNDDCSLQFTCDNGEATSIALGCRGDEVCKVVGGERGCFCRDGTQWNGEECSDVPCQCKVWGDPHYITFDGKRYDFQGDCEYILVESCNHGNLPTFKVIGSNDKNVPSAEVSFLRRVRLEYNNFEFEMFNSGILKVDGVTKTLPYSVGEDNYVTVTFAPPDKMILTTHFGLQLIFTYNIAGLQIEVSPDYYQKLCGMCGTCNSDETDDFLLPSHEQAESASTFGNGWVTGDKECSPDEGVSPCQEDSDEKRAAEDLCFVLINEGPLRVCREFVDPKPFFQTCVYDVCATHNDEALCANIDQYVQACRRLGGNPGEWWTDVKECAAPCPKDMIYTQCGTGCPATCARRNQEIKCDVEGIETCLCPEGKLLDGQKCVYPEECGCDTEDGTYISAGSVFIKEGCSERCTCTLGQLQCEAYQCHAQASCEIRSGDRDCYCSNGYVGNGQECEQADCECFIWGDDHFRTFDHVMFSYNGGCEHTLLKNIDNTMPSFELIGKFGESESSKLQGLRLQYDGAGYEVGKNGILVKDGMEQSKTFTDGKVSSLTLAGGSVVITTNFGLSISYDRETMASIKVKATLRGKVFGMCGTCNNDKSDDLTLPDRTITTETIEFGNQWVLNDCDPGADEQEACTEGSLDQVQAKDRCYPLVDPNGVFADCHDYLHPVAHYQTCIQDYCTQAGLLCDSFTAYAAQCRSSGGNPQDWRKTIKECNFRCPRKIPYTPCASGCPGSCVDLDGDNECLHSCVEDCQCPFGLVLQNSKCVKPEKCDCYLKELKIIIPENIPLVNDNCTQRWECLDGVVVNDHGYECDSNAVCGEKNGIYGCHCNEGYEGDGQICRKVPRPPDCNQALLDGNTADGVYTIYPVGYPGGSLKVYCDMTTDGGGWTVIQKRENGVVDFDKTWEDYKIGFGELDGEFWLGNEAIRSITQQEGYSLRIDLVDRGGNSYFATYESFGIGTEGESYQINLSGQTSGNYAMFFLNHNTWRFATRDRDNDLSCADTTAGGWWMGVGSCYYVHLNGNYEEHFKWLFLSLKSSEMKIRPIVPNP